MLAYRFENEVDNRIYAEIWEDNDCFVVCLYGRDKGCYRTIETYNEEEAIDEARLWVQED